MDLSIENILLAFLLALLAGASTCVGAVIAFFGKKDDTRMLSLGLGFSAGVMVYIAFMELLPGSIKEFEKSFEHGEFIALLVFFISMLCCVFIDKIVPSDVNPHEIKEQNEYEELKFCLISEREIHIQKNHGKKAVLRRTGIFTALAIGVHNFPEGFATFASSLESLQLGLVIAAAVAIHNIPEGVAVSLPIYHATGEKKKAFIYSLLSGLAEPVGALFGALLILPFFGTLSLAFSFAFVSAVMIFISFDELFPVAKNYAHGHECLYGLIFGMAIMAFSLKFFAFLG